MVYRMEDYEVGWEDRGGPSMADLRDASAWVMLEPIRERMRSMWDEVERDHPEWLAALGPRP